MKPACGPGTIDNETTRNGMFVILTRPAAAKVRECCMRMKLMLAAVVLITLNGCATILNGTSDNVQVNSEPPQAKVYVDGYAVATTPAKVKLESKKVHYIEVKKEGYETWGYQVTNGVGAGWIILDIFFGIVPIVVDAVTGAWYSLDSGTINAVLEEAP